MNDYKTEKELDQLLGYCVKQDVTKPIMIKTISAQFPDYNLATLLPMLEFRGFVIPFSCTFNGRESPDIFYSLFQVTPAAIYFVHNSSFVDSAKQKQKEKRRFNFEYFTMGWDTLIAFISLVISAIALFIAVK